MFGIQKEFYQNALDVEYGTNSTYEQSHMPKINSSSVKICESSRPRLAQKFSIVTRAVVLFAHPIRSLEACHAAQAERRSANTATAPASAAAAAAAE
jgi:hypothetical protein